MSTQNSTRKRRVDRYDKRRQHALRADDNRPRISQTRFNPSEWRA